MPVQPQSKPKKSRRPANPLAGLPPLNLNAAGIDVGGASHFVAVPADRDPRPVRQFDSFTADLHALADWLAQCGIDTVAMESTGVYWIPLYQILQARGFEVNLVNARHAKNVPGRKTDVADCQWLQQLHTFGLLKNSFRPPDQICALRSLLRQRENLIAAASKCVQHMQKALVEMNIQLTNVISDISGETGLAIINAILAGERDPERLAQLKNPRVKASTATIAKSLQGNWRDELLFILAQSVWLYQGYQTKIAECDGYIEAQLRLFDAKATPAQTPPLAKRGRRKGGNRPNFDLGSHLLRIAGVDLTRIDGLDVLTVQTIISEVGLDMSPWKTEKHFASWLGLCPDNRISGGKVLKRKTRKVLNRAATAFRLGAWNLRRSQSALGANYRRLRTRLGAPKAITAMAHKLARLFYRMLKFGQEYVDQGMAHYESRYREQQLKWLHKQAASLNMQVLPAQRAAT